MASLPLSLKPIDVQKTEGSIVEACFSSVSTSFAVKNCANRILYLASQRLKELVVSVGL